jgi:hypothetical protein
MGSEIWKENGGIYNLGAKGKADVWEVKVGSTKR